MPQLEEDKRFDAKAEIDLVDDQVYEIKFQLALENNKPANYTGLLRWLRQTVKYRSMLNRRTSSIINGRSPVRFSLC